MDVDESKNFIAILLLILIEVLCSELATEQQLFCWVSLWQARLSEVAVLILDHYLSQRDIWHLHAAMMQARCDMKRRAVGTTLGLIR